MELLVFKTGEHYIRVRETEHELTSMAKASVYPLAQVEMVEKLFQELNTRFDALEIKKLTITESDYK